MTWIDIHDGPRIAAMVEPRSGRVAIRSFGDRLTQLEQLGLEGKKERGQWTLFASPLDFDRVAEIVGTAFTACLQEAFPGWDEWKAEEAGLDDQRAANRTTLGLTCRLSEPDMLHQAVFTRWLETAAPAGHPFHQLYPYQKLGVWWLQQAMLRAIVGDEMGVGKTPQVLMALELDPAVRRAVVVVPAAVLLNWQREAARWAPSFTTQLCTSRWKPSVRPPDRLLLLVSWGLAYRVMDKLGSGWDAVAVDEAHRMMHRNSLRSQAVVGLCHGSTRRMLATGTYLRSDHHELWTLLHAIAPLHWPRWLDYAEQFCAPKNVNTKNGVVRKYMGSSRSQELLLTTMPWIMRRTRAEVLPHIPPKQRQVLHQQAPSKLARRTLDLYQKLRDTPADEYADSGVLTEINELWQETGLAKVDAAVDWIMDAVRQGEPVVVFVYHRAVHAGITAALDNVEIAHRSVTGAMTPKVKDASVRAFMAGKVDVLFGSDAAKEGITLTRAAFSLHVERWWVPADEEQAEDRLNRPGQTRATTAVYLHMPKTLDDHMERVSKRKRAIVGAATGSIMPELIKTLRSNG